MNHKLVFLDIDGVLNSNVDLMNGIHLCNKKVLLLRSLLAMDSDIKIVISSAWRILYTQEVLCDMLYRVGLGTRSMCVLGFTPTRVDPKYKKEASVLNSLGIQQYRGYEINAWLEENRGSWTDYVILDDSGDMTNDQIKHTYVRVDANIGLTEANCQQMCDILGLGEFVHNNVYLDTKEEIRVRRKERK